MKTTRLTDLHARTALGLPPPPPPPPPPSRESLDPPLISAQNLPNINAMISPLVESLTVNNTTRRRNNLSVYFCTK